MTEGTITPIALQIDYTVPNDLKQMSQGCPSAPSKSVPWSSWVVAGWDSCIVDVSGTGVLEFASSMVLVTSSALCVFSRSAMRSFSISCTRSATSPVPILPKCCKYWSRAVRSASQDHLCLFCDSIKIGFANEVEDAPPRILQFEDLTVPFSWQVPLELRLESKLN